MHLRTRGAREVEQQRVEGRAIDLVGAGVREAEPVLKMKPDLPRAAARRELRSVLVQKRAVEKLTNPEPLEDRHGVGQQRFADVEARKFFALQHDDPPSCPRQKRGRRAARGAAADDRHVEGFLHEWGAR